MKFRKQYNKTKNKILSKEEIQKQIEQAIKDNKLTKYKNKSIHFIKQVQGINSNKSSYYSKQKTINEKIGLPNRIFKCKLTDRIRLINEEIYFYDKELKEDVLIDEFCQPDELHNFHISINPNKLVSKEKLKDILKLFWCKYGYFIYGRKYIKLLNQKYTIAIESETYNHIHLNIIDIKPDDFKILSGYMELFFMAFFTNAEIYCKVIDNLQSSIAYDTKKADTIFLTEQDFIGGKNGK